MPPVTEAAVHQAASRNARSGRASDIGTSITSGGIGKKELSTNATAVNIARACRLPAAATHQSYKRRSKEIGLAASTVIGTLRVRERWISGACGRAWSPGPRPYAAGEPVPGSLAIFRQCRTSARAGPSRSRRRRDGPRNEPRAPRDCTANRRFRESPLRAGRAWRRSPLRPPLRRVFWPFWHGQRATAERSAISPGLSPERRSRRHRAGQPNHSCTQFTPIRAPNRLTTVKSCGKTGIILDVPPAPSAMVMPMTAVAAVAAVAAEARGVAVRPAIVAIGRVIRTVVIAIVVIAVSYTHLRA